MVITDTDILPTLVYMPLCMFQVVYISLLLICFCRFDLFCPLLDKDTFIKNVYIVLSCPIKYFPFQPVVHNWFIKGHGMYCSVYGKVHIKDPLLLIEKSCLCGGSGFPSKKCVNVTI